MATRTTDNPKRQRLAAEVRREQLLVRAGELIATDGVAALTMERLAADADVSKGLVYLYFKNRAGLLNALLDLEWAAFVEDRDAHHNPAAPFEDQVRELHRAYFERADRRGILHVLMSERSIEAEVGVARAAYLQQALAYWTADEALGGRLEGPAAQTAAVLFIGSAVTAAALIAGGADRQLVEDVQVTMVLATVSALAAQPAA